MGICYENSFLSVQKGISSTLGDASVKTLDQSMSLSDFAEDCSVILVDGLDMQTAITCYGGLISGDGEMVNVGDFVKFAKPSEVHNYKAYVQIIEYAC